MDINQEVDQPSLKDEGYNLELLACIRKIIGNYKKDIEELCDESLIFEVDFQKSKGNMDKYFATHFFCVDWAIEQVETEKYLVWHDLNGKKISMTKLTQNIIFDILELVVNVRESKKLKNENLKNVAEEIFKKIGTISRPEIVPQDFYYLAIGSNIVEAEGYEVIILTKIFFIRLALEQKLKSMLEALKEKLKTTKCQFEEKIPDYQLGLMLNFFREKHKQYFDLPDGLDIQKLGKINTWCNKTLIHYGKIPSIWAIWKAIDYISLLFPIQKNKRINLKGFDFLKEKFNCN